VVGVEVGAGIVGVGVDGLAVIVGIGRVFGAVSEVDIVSTPAGWEDPGEQVERNNTSAIAPKESSFRLPGSDIGLLQY
jgi:hypothetical protein